MSPASAVHSQAVDSVDLSLAFQLTVPYSLHSQAVDVIGLIQQNVLVVSDTLHAHIVDSLTIGGGSFLIGGRLLVVSGLDRVMSVS